MVEKSIAARVKRKKKRKYTHHIHKNELTVDHEELTMRVHTAYVFGKTDAFIEYYAQGAGISGKLLTLELGNILLKSARRKGMGIID